MHSNRYIIFFTIIMCVIISFILSTVSISLKDKQEINREIDKHKNILIAAGISINNDNIQDIYEKRVELIMLNKNGNIIADDELIKINKNSYLPLYKIKDLNDSNKANAYVYPVTGKGLWSTLHGYLAVNANGIQIIGLTFYKHGETPGLGAEIEKPAFRNKFIGKKLYNKDKFVGITVAKGKARDHTNYSFQSEHIVDGISGATITAKGVEKMIKREPLKYHNFFYK